MSSAIELAEIRAEGNRIRYTVHDRSGMRLLKKETVHAWIQFDHAEEFGLDLASLPLSVLAIPMSLYLLPVTYYYPVTLRLPVMDEMLHERLPEIRAAYEDVYGRFPESEWGGVFTVRTERNELPAHPSGYGKVVFFSGGVDAVSAGVNNAGAGSVLVSIPSIESQAKNDGPLREQKYRLISDFSAAAESPWVLISNNFNDDVFNDGAIQARLDGILRSEAFRFDGWFGIKYLANMSSAAPLAYALGIPSLIMGSTFEPLEGEAHTNRDGAAPELSDAFAYAGISFAEQDELRTRRTAKTAGIIRWCRARGKTVRLWTCFDDRAEQCGVCAKCVRTQLNILVAGESPRDWGFALFDERKFSRHIRSYRYWEKNPCWLWDNVDAIDDARTYPQCDEMLHWLKKVGYREYQRRARKMLLVRNMARRLVSVHRWPHYAAAVVRRLRRHRSEK